MAKISKSVNQLWRSSRRKIQRGNCIKKLSKREKKWNALGLNRGYFVVTKGGWEHKEWWDSSSIFWLPLEIKRWQSSSDTKGMTNCYSRRLRWRSSWRNCLKTQEKNKWKKSIESSSWTVLVTLVSVEDKKNTKCRSFLLKSFWTRCLSWIVQELCSYNSIRETDWRCVFTVDWKWNLLSGRRQRCIWGTFSKRKGFEIVLSLQFRRYVLLLKVCSTVMKTSRVWLKYARDLGCSYRETQVIQDIMDGLGYIRRV